MQGSGARRGAGGRVARTRACPACRGGGATLPGGRERNGAGPCCPPPNGRPLCPNPHLPRGSAWSRVLHGAVGGTVQGSALPSWAEARVARTGVRPDARGGCAPPVAPEWNAAGPCRPEPDRSPRCPTSCMSRRPVGREGRVRCAPGSWPSVARLFLPWEVERRMARARQEQLVASVRTNGEWALLFEVDWQAALKERPHGAWRRQWLLRAEHRWALPRGASR